MGESLGLVKDGKKGKGDREGLWEIRVVNTLSRRKGTSKDTGRYWSETSGEGEPGQRNGSGLRGFQRRWVAG